MSVGRRALLSSAFLGLAALLAPDPASAQDRSHQLWQHTLTPDQVRDALAKMGAGDFGTGDPFQKMVKDFLLKNNPGVNTTDAEEAIKRLTNDPKLMEQLKQLARQHQTDPGRVGVPKAAELEKMFRDRQDKGELPKLPDGIKLGKNPADPGGPPDRKDRPDVGDPGGVRDLPKDNPDQQPKKLEIADPRARQNPPKDTIKLDQNPFPPPEESTDPRTKSLEAFTAVWERNIGPLDETPEVRRALFDLVGGENGFGFDIKDGAGNSLWDLLKNGGVDGEGLGNLLDGVDGPGGGKWDFGKWEWPSLGRLFDRGGSPSNTGGGSSWSWFNRNSSGTPKPSPSSGGWGGGGGFGLGGIGGAWVPLLVVLLVVLAIVVWLKLKHMGDPVPAAAVAGGLGPWPVDPRDINTREDVVKAFEYLSVLTCGPAAKNWTHGTIAEALADLASTHEETAVMLARLYELARYAPLDEPLTRDELLEARRLACALAGVPY